MYRSPYKPESGIKSFLMMPTEDFEEFDILPYLLEAIAFLSRAETSGGCAFVHCNYGVNRSGVVAAAYLMVTQHKPLLQVINELKARRSLILSNVGFRRQLVRFARCRGLLDADERRSRRSPRLETSSRSVTPSKDEPKDDASAGPESAETSAVKETSTKNGGVQPINGYHATPSALTISTDLKLNGSTLSLRPHANTSRRERLLRDIDSTIGTLSVGDTSSTYYIYHQRDDISPSSQFYEHPRPSTYLPVSEYTSDSVPEPSGRLLSSQLQFDVLHHPAHSSDSDEDFAPSSLIGDKSFYGRAESSNAILNEYLNYKDTSALSSQFAIPAVSVHVPPPAAVAEPYIMSRVEPRYYGSSATTSSAIAAYDEADINSFLAQRNASRPLLSWQRRLDHAITSSDTHRQTVSSLDAVLGLSSSYSAGRAPMSLGLDRKPPLLPSSAYVDRWYRRYTPTGSAAHTMSFDTGRHDSGVSDDPISGHGMKSVGRTIATTVTPAPGYGPRSNYARSHSVSRY